MNEPYVVVTSTVKQKESWRSVLNFFFFYYSHNSAGLNLPEDRNFIVIHISKKICLLKSVYLSNVNISYVIFFSILKSTIAVQSLAVVAMEKAPSPPHLPKQTQKVVSKS